MRRESARYFRRLCLGLSLICIVGAPSPSSAQGRLVNCSEAQDKDKNDNIVARCELRLSESINVSKVTVAGGDQKRDATFQANEALSPPTPVLFLLDQSSATDKAVFDRLKSVISGVLDLDSKSLSFAVYGFTSEIRAIAPLGTAPLTSKLALNGVSLQRGTSELLRSINSVLPLLRASKAERNVLVVLSDGRVEDTAYSVAEISKQLAEARVTVFAIAPSRAPDDLTAAQSLRRLAEETSGEFLVASNRDSRDHAITQLKAHLLNGGFVSFLPVAKDTHVEAELSNGKKITATFSSKLVKELPPTTKPDQEMQHVPASTWEWMRAAPAMFAAWLTRRWINLAITVVGALLSGAVCWFASHLIFGRRSAAFSASADEIPAMISDLKPTLARFEFLDSDESSDLVHSATTRIGRHNDNDIVLKNTSVHRHHAILKRDPNGPFVLIDMDTENGVQVNGTRVKSTKLQDGDLVELGEVRMRFRVA
jgi:hypothetical protein